MPTSLKTCFDTPVKAIKKYFIDFYKTKQKSEIVFFIALEMLTVNNL